MDDDQRLALPPVLLILAVLACLWSRTALAAPTSGVVPGDYCDPDDRARSWTAAQKAVTRERVLSACMARGGSDLYCGWHLAAVKRESWGGIASAVHLMGVDVDGDPEFGLGPMGLSVKWHHLQWPGDDENPAFCTPEVSYLVADAIAHTARRVYGARNAVELQAIYGGGRGSRACYDRGAPSWLLHIPGLAWIAELVPRRRECIVTPLRRHADAVCKRMPGVDCWKSIGPDGMGPEDGLIAWDTARARYVVTPAGRSWAIARATLATR